MKRGMFPVRSRDSLNYWCTWSSQNDIAGRKGTAKGLTAKDFEGAAGAALARDEMNEDTLLGKGGLCDAFPALRGDLYLVLDDGWDVPYGAGRESIRDFGSLTLDTTRFPSFTGTPAERLQKLNDAVKSRGWKGLGIWVAPQLCHEQFGVKYEEAPSLHEAYWRERILWSRHADVRYWKVDWGKDSASVSCRSMMTELGKRLFPELVIEHTFPLMPINGEPKQGTVRFAEQEAALAKAKAILSFSEAYRSYDVTDDRLSACSTLDRLSEMLPFSYGVVNCEDELYVGAALGCAVGIMRSVYGKGRSQRSERLDEVTAALRWQTYAPAFAGGVLETSDELLYDECFFTRNDTWYGEIMDTTVTQAAPAVMARNTALPTVEPTERAPFVLAAQNPTGAYALAAVKRYRYRENTEMPRVACFADTPERVGIFGDFETVTLSFSQKPTAMTVQSLAGGEVRSVELSDYADDNRLVLPYSLLARYRISTDQSENAVMLTFTY